MGVDGATKRVVYIFFVVSKQNWSSQSHRGLARVGRPPGHISSFMTRRIKVYRSSLREVLVASLWRLASACHSVVVRHFFLCFYDQRVGEISFRFGEFWAYSMVLGNSKQEMALGQ